jgi:tetraacyldisaccharide 4'-kinase
MLGFLYNVATDKYKGIPVLLIKCFLFLLSFIYGLIIKILAFFCRLRPFCLDCKVISVGNITLGGTGKTALVEYIARYLKNQGRKVAIITRGYKRKTRDSMGDEPYMLKQHLKDVPVIVDANRRRAVLSAIRDYAVDTVIFDDGFQQWRIKKDLEIVTINATDPFGNRYLIPRGILREPLSSLRRADCFVLTNSNLDTKTEETKNILKALNPQAQVSESVHNPLAFYNIDKPDALYAVSLLKGRRVTLFSGIGNPGSFEELISRLGIIIGLVFRFPDHHNYNEEELDKIIKDSSDRDINTIITTEKDAARLDGLRQRGKGVSILVLKVEMKIKDEQKFCDRLLKLYSV